VNQFGSLIATNTLTKERLEYILKELVAYTEYHFKDEEKVMFANNVDVRHASKHVRDHKDFVREIKSIDPDEVLELSEK
jgi:hemerythrin